MQLKGRPLAWCSLVVFFSLLQYWIVLLISLLDESFKFSTMDIIKEGGLIFFSTSIVVTFAIDFFTSKKNPPEIAHEEIGILYALFPALIVILSLVIYCVIKIGKPNSISIILSQGAIFVASLLYSYKVKERQEAR